MTNPADQRAFIDKAIKIVRDLRVMFDARAQAMGLTYSRGRALAVIARNEGSTQRELAELLDIETPSLKRLLDGLETSGFIDRRAVEGDRRANSIRLTEGARDQADTILDFMADMRGQVFDGIPPEEIATAQDVLDRVLANIRRMRQE
ncbi:MarR family winged helix-turn-helix transcriptional regulator [Qingshengfaniella alkalisoli]|uniref:MarR family transcriptional regulator n=1 Tax=Qingshengfaniella alkalisoli TaxID=2599296 RepID=A0A5B8J6S7_9RHOB|nr:MarR family transcriptional regulator [Qingshengfaniella alkalisoli]QDY70040.1 MarR family transcriptional regulator [Qingshengfaniella alkalisoli]